MHVFTFGGPGQPQMEQISLDYFRIGMVLSTTGTPSSPSSSMPLSSIISITLPSSSVGTSEFSSLSTSLSTYVPPLSTSLSSAREPPSTSSHSQTTVGTPPPTLPTQSSPTGHTETISSPLVSQNVQARQSSRPSVVPIAAGTAALGLFMLFGLLYVVHRRRQCRGARYRPDPFFSEPRPSTVSYQDDAVDLRKSGANLEASIHREGTDIAAAGSSMQGNDSRTLGSAVAAENLGPQAEQLRDAEEAKTHEPPHTFHGAYTGTTPSRPHHHGDGSLLRGDEQATASTVVPSYPKHHADAARVPWYAPPQLYGRAQSILTAVSAEHRRRDRGVQPRQHNDSGLRSYNDESLPPPYTAG
ncbi:hypothetical protein C8Q80DRAFT_1210802 [Daedaleopsis nitida]|nr:hypothetical protein C8Q80DRAFT_1210802 [Daedaleopsis nitida]